MGIRSEWILSDGISFITLRFFLLGQNVAGYNSSPNNLFYSKLQTKSQKRRQFIAQYLFHPNLKYCIFALEHNITIASRLVLKNPRPFQIEWLAIRKIKSGLTQCVKICLSLIVCLLAYQYLTVYERLQWSVKLISAICCTIDMRASKQFQSRCREQTTNSISSHSALQAFSYRNIPSNSVEAATLFSNFKSSKTHLILSIKLSSLTCSFVSCHLICILVFCIINMHAIATVYKQFEFHYILWLY